MSRIEILGESYEFPEIQDDGFNAIRRQIEERRATIAEGSREKRFFGLIRKAPTLNAERQLELTEELVANYDELVDSLKSKIGICSSVFMRMGEGVRGFFAAKLAELEQMESRRSSMLQEAQSHGQTELVAAYEAEKDRIRALAINLTKSTILIIRKLRHALEALEILVADEVTQRAVLESLKGNLSLYRKAHDFRRDLDRIEADIAAATDFALDFESLLRDKLGPLAALIDEISKVDGRVAESLSEIQKLSLQLESRKSVTTGLRGFNDKVFDAFLHGQMRKDAIDGIISAMSNPEADWGEIDFAVELSDEAKLDFAMLASNMGVLVRSGLEDLRSRAPEQLLGASGGAPTLEPLVVAADDELDIEVKPAPNFLIKRDEGAPDAEEAVPQKVQASTVTGETEPQPATQPVEPVQTAPVQENVSPKTSEAPPSPASTPPPADPEPRPEPLPWVEAARRASANPGAGGTGPSPLRGEYRVAISRADPALIVFLLDRSGSMDEHYAEGMSRARYLARTVDNALLEMAVRCHKAEGTRDYFHVACLGYGDEKVGNAFSSPLASGDYATISAIASSPLRLVDDPVGGKIPQWIEPIAGGSTPMCAAFERACSFVAQWCDAHPRSYPPTVINVSDGESTDGDPRRPAEILRRLHTNDGECLVFNLHVGEGGTGEIVFPESSTGLNEHARRLYDMSSPFPPHLRDQAQAAGFRVGGGSRFFAWGAGAALATRFFELGTRPVKLT